MTTKKTNSAPRQTHTRAVQAPSALHHLNALLHTMRSIAQYEDTLCELTHEVKRSGGLSPELREELREILEKIPSHEYVVDLDAIRAALAEQLPAPGKAAPPVPARKGSAIAKKKSGRKSSK